jgi:hypothetical protein
MASGPEAGRGRGPARSLPLTPRTTLGGSARRGTAGAGWNVCGM